MVEAVKTKRTKGAVGKKKNVCVLSMAVWGGRAGNRLTAGREALGLYMKLAAQLCLQTLWAICACGLALCVHGRKCECSCTCMQVHLWSVLHDCVSIGLTCACLHMYMHCVYIHSWRVHFLSIYGIFTVCTYGL